MQLLRRAYKLKLENDPILSNYIKILINNSKQFLTILKQEQLIQSYIDNNNIELLSKILSGRGNSKLIISCPSEYIQSEWYYYLTQCSEGIYKQSHNNNTTTINTTNNIENNQIIYSGFLEKAARNDQGLIRGWRKRFFQLNNTTLIYYINNNKIKKGNIRILNSGIKKLNLLSYNNRIYCIEIEEGKDISLIDSDLIVEGQKYLLLKKIKNYENILLYSINNNNFYLLNKILNLINKNNIIIDYNILNNANNIMSNQKNNIPSGIYSNNNNNLKLLNENEKKN